ncbi:MAG: DUF3137 domain-containing protein [Alphaproteobacteria bacterium]|nr:DUF3137 domain-containing protein [Alphaproteobacteria bacterium]
MDARPEDSLHAVQKEEIRKLMRKEFPALDMRRKLFEREFLKRRNIMILSMPVLLWLVTLPSFEGEGGKVGWFLASAILIINAFYILSLWIREPKIAYAEQYQVTVLPAIARIFGMSYSARMEIAPADIQYFGILSEYHDYQSHGAFYGEYKGAEISFSEIEFVCEEGNRSHRWKMMAVMVELPNPVFGHTIMVPQGYRIMEFFNSRVAGLERADMVDPSFEKKYNVYTNDQVEARYLMHPAMVQRIDDLERAFFRRPLSLGLRENRLLLLVNIDEFSFVPAEVWRLDKSSRGRGDGIWFLYNLLFRGMLGESLRDSEIPEEIRGEIASVLRLIDYLDLHGGGGTRKKNIFE